jgi:UDP-N-acetylmuramate--alanine ligase
MTAEGRVYFIGIGGIGTSSLARFFLSCGFQVSGSDAADSELIKELRRDGIEIYIGHRVKNIRGDVNRVIYSAAVKTDNPEFKTALEYGLQMQNYAEALGELTQEFYTITVSGSHGKSTTTALLALLLTEAKIDPTVIIGTKLREWKGTNFRKGRSKYLLIEADEWNKSFHNYFPKIAVIINIDKEHLDTYKDFRGVVQGFETYIKRVPKDGYLIVNAKDKALMRIIKSLKNKPTVIYFNKTKPQFQVGMPGEHNQLNAEAAWQVGKLLGIKKETAKKVFKNFTGAWRRLEKLRFTGFKNIAQIYSDYAHHPTEIKATLKGLREKYPHKRLVCVFEPHQKDRLTRLFPEFTRAFSAADEIIFLPVYQVKGRDYKKGRDSFDLAQAVRKRKRDTFYAHEFEDVFKLLSRNSEAQKQVVVFMGAGDIDANVRKVLTK